MTNAAHLERVTGRLRPAVVAFIRQRGTGSLFHAEELHEYVKRHTQAAPESANRVMRSLNAEGEIGYELVDRGRSLYRITATHPKPKDKPLADAEQMSILEMFE